MNLPKSPCDELGMIALAEVCPMILQVLFGRILGCWILAAVVAAAEVLPAYGRGAAPVQSVVSAARRCIRYGVVLTVGIIFATTFESVDKNWDFHLELLSYDLAAYSGYVRQAVLFGFWIGFMMVISPIVRLLDRFVPRDRVQETPVAESGS
jgi:hypothetical protein